eukprot:CAMPEP_0173470690 /NCGR_PEP_ID=MMETSP1357-20121228/78010_1 /TAXON_ID=77926 /ORGANISM="Hemiselmis rufescens, Strain PCC563" /LENGTH=282 /DNA_ID=CAMNT_0014438975 /DNA_START=345 /DNA_END=1190 /DNA_ORIENTATION=+
MSCIKWADCKKAQQGKECACGESCKCGSVTHEMLEEFKKTACPWSDCKCGKSCGCGKACPTVGKTLKTPQEWITAYKSGPSAPWSGDCPWTDCSCEKVCKDKNNGKCACGDSCGCGSVTHETLEDFKKRACPWSDCKCGEGCGCGKECPTVGKTPKTEEQFIAAYKRSASPTSSECPWSDCSCEKVCKDKNNGKCACGDSCGCGSVTHETLEDFKKRACPWSDCKCGEGCGCGKECPTVGKTPKTEEQFIAAYKRSASPTSSECPWSDCSCEKVCKDKNNGK